MKFNETKQIEKLLWLRMYWYFDGPGENVRRKSKINAIFLGEDGFNRSSIAFHDIYLIVDCASWHRNLVAS